VNTIDSLKERLGNSLSYKTNGAQELTKLVDGKDTVADKVGFGGGKVREDETRTIAEDNIWAEVDGLEVLGLSWCRRDGYLL
jgi:hypothetical protein